MTFRNARKAVLVACLAAPFLRADFSYEQTTKITGGALVSMMKFVGAFSKDAHKAMDPVKSTTAIQGNRMVHRTADSASIIDLDKETITTVDYAKRTYSVATFAQIKQGIEAMSQKMREQKDAAKNENPAGSGQNPSASGQNIDMHFDVKVNDTGQSKVINGNNAREMVMTITMQGTDAKSGAKGGLDVTSDMWVAPQVSGYQEVRDFYRRMSEKLEWTPGANPILMSRPDTARAMAQLYKEGSKLDGMPVYETIKMGGKIEGQNQASGSQSQSGSQGQSQTSADSTPPPASVSQALGAALGGRFGGFGRRKKQAQQDSDSSSSAPSGNANASSNTNNSSASGSLIEMTTEVLNYSAGHADPSLFEIPSGFSQVENAMPSRPARQ